MPSLVTWWNGDHRRLEPAPTKVVLHLGGVLADQLDPDAGVPASTSATSPAPAYKRATPNIPNRIVPVSSA